MMSPSPYFKKLIQCADRPTMFPEDKKKHFNCTTSSKTAEGDHICTSAPCGESDECSWQVEPGEQVDFTSGRFYKLYKCE